MHYHFLPVLYASVISSAHFKISHGLLSRSNSWMFKKRSSTLKKWTYSSNIQIASTNHAAKFRLHLTIVFPRFSEYKQANLKSICLHGFLQHKGGLFVVFKQLRTFAQHVRQVTIASFLLDHLSISMHLHVAKKMYIKQQQQQKTKHTGLQKTLVFWVIRKNSLSKHSTREETFCNASQFPEQRVTSSSTNPILCAASLDTIKSFCNLQMQKRKW